MFVEMQYCKMLSSHTGSLFHISHLDDFDYILFEELELQLVFYLMKNTACKFLLGSHKQKIHHSKANIQMLHTYNTYTT